jgi:hypothetical protein
MTRFGNKNTNQGEGEKIETQVSQGEDVGNVNTLMTPSRFSLLHTEQATYRGRARRTSSNLRMEGTSYGCRFPVQGWSVTGFYDADTADQQKGRKYKAKLRSSLISVEK